MKKLIRTGNDPILKQMCAPVGNESVSDLMQQMVIAAKRSRNAVGLAAPQVGDARRVILTICADASGTVRRRFFVNPVIVSHGENQSVKEEQCLSYPGKSKEVARWDEITLSYQNGPADPVRTQKFSGWHARVIQHEVDHLNGICRVGDDSAPDEQSPKYSQQHAALASAVLVAACAGW